MQMGRLIPNEALEKKATKKGFATGYLRILNFEDPIYMITGI
jgi:hypothetical protein